MVRFPLAPMAGLILWLTLLVLPLPLVMLWIGFQGGAAALIWLPALFVTVIYMIVWFYMRPSAFEVSDEALAIIWPLRRYSVPADDIEKVELVSGSSFRGRYGYGMRIGAGGLWGGFGLLKTKSVTFRFYISRMDDYVIVWRRSDRPLLITPVRPQAFVELVERRRQRRAPVAGTTS